MTGATTILNGGSAGGRDRDQKEHPPPSRTTKERMLPRHQQSIALLPRGGVVENGRELARQRISQEDLSSNDKSVRSQEGGTEQIPEGVRSHEAQKKLTIFLENFAMAKFSQ